MLILNWHIQLWQSQIRCCYYLPTPSHFFKPLYHCLSFWETPKLQHLPILYIWTTALNYERLFLYAGVGCKEVSLQEPLGWLSLLPSADDGTLWLTFLGCLKNCANVNNIKWTTYFVNLRCCRSNDLCNELADAWVPSQGLILETAGPSMAPISGRHCCHSLFTVIPKNISDCKHMALSLAWVKKNPSPFLDSLSWPLWRGEGAP